MSGIKVPRRLKRKWRKSAPWVKHNLFALCMAMFHLMLLAGPIGTYIEPLLLDGWFRLHSNPPPSEVIIVAIDEQSYAKQGVSLLQPWPRRAHIELLKRLQEAGATQVLFDMVFTAAGPDRKIDERFAQALTLIPTFIGSYETTPVQSSNSNHEPDGTMYQDPLEVFAKAARGVVTLNIPLDHGIVRRFKSYVQTEDLHPPPAMALLAETENSALLPKPRDFIHFYGPPKTLHTIPYYQVLESTPAALLDLFKGRTVFVGSQLQSEVGVPVKDSFVTPASSYPMSGVEIQATTGANVLRQDWIKRLQPKIEHVLLNTTAFLLCLAISLLTPARAGLFLLVTIVIWGGVSYLAFRLGFFIPGICLTGIVLPIMFLMSTLKYYLVLQRSYQDIENALGVKLHLAE